MRKITNITYEAARCEEADTIAEEGASCIGLCYGFVETIDVCVTDEGARCEGAAESAEEGSKEGGASCISASRGINTRPVAE